LCYFNGDGRFPNITQYSTGFSSVPVAIVFSDMNKNNHLDLVVANWGISDVLVFLGKGNGSFSEPKVYFVA
jgi:hypothetical protein